MGFYLDAFGSSHAGKVRKNNEDSLLTGDGRDETLFAVADGIGGFEAGEVASGIAVGVLEELEPSGSLEEAVREANRRIVAAAREDEKLSGMGTTIVAARFSAGGGTSAGAVATAEISHVGDSRAYLLRGGELTPVTEDHSLVAELVRSGDLTRAQASEHPQKNLITRALGAEEEVQVDTTVLPVEADDRLLLCSDGLTDMVREEKVGELLAAERPEEAARALVKAALDGGGADNVTVVVVDVKEERAGGRPRTDTQRMRALSQEEAVESPGRRGARRRDAAGRAPAKARSARPRKGRSAPARLMAWVVRALAALMVLTALASPFYLWGSSRYFLGFDSGEVVIYRGLPEEYTMGLRLNQEFRRTNLRESKIEETYRQQINEHKLYSSKEEAERVVRDLETPEPGRGGR